MGRVQREIVIECDSNPAAGSKNLSADGSSFEIELHEPIHVPADAQNCKITIESARVWWTTVNIGDSNNKFYIATNSDPEEVYTIPAGLYNAAGLNQTLKQLWSNAHVSDLPFTIAENESTQKIVLLYAGSEEMPTEDEVHIDFTNADTPRDILGFDSKIVTVDNDANKVVNADNVARFNTVNAFHIRGDIVQGMRVNDNYGHLLLAVPITVAPGRQVVYEPIRSPNHEARDLVGRKRNRFRFWLTNELGEAVDTNGDFWGFRLKITWLE